MALTPQDVSRIAHLARLELSGAEQASLLSQLNGFFSIVEQMGAVDTTGVEPLYTPLSAVQAVELRLRDDAVTEGNDRSANQRSAPQVADGLFIGEDPELHEVVSAAAGPELSPGAVTVLLGHR